jgi:hypothetical protein
MVNGTERGSAASLLRALAGQRAKLAVDKKQTTFAQQLESSLTGSERIIGRRSEQTASSPVSNRQNVAIVEQARQNSVATTPAPQPMPSADIGPFAAAAKNAPAPVTPKEAAPVTPKAPAPAAPAAAAPSNTTTAAPATDPLSVLREAMQKAGISGTVGLTETNEIVQFPGGSYRNHLIKADFGNGVTENYSVDLMMKNPWLTAFEMKRLMNGGVA